MVGQSEITSLFNELLDVNEGDLASYIPELAKVNPNLFSVSIHWINGESLNLGDSSHQFTIQSVSKPFAYGFAAEMVGYQEILKRVGVEPSGEAFDSIIELEKKTHRPYNPMINSGAIAISHLLLEKFGNLTEAKLFEFFHEICGRNLSIQENVYLSEKSTANRNRAISYLLKNFNIISSDIEAGLDLYFKQCSLGLTTSDLSLMAATLANRGVNPLTQKSCLSPEINQKVLSLMMTCGMYDTAGEWAFDVGIPAKSGVSGCLVAVVPGKMGISVFSPRIDKHGHSVRGYRFIELLSRRLNLSLFNGNI